MSEQQTKSATPQPPTAARAARQIVSEYNNKKTGTGWHRYYKEICEKCERYAKGQQFTTLESERPQNRSLNRYRDVNPYDHSRIILQRGSVDYINANLVKLERADRQYILTQGPLEQTVEHFWLMVWEQNSRAILMLNKLMEKKQIKCHLYWPNQLGEELKLNKVKLTVELVRCETYQNFVRRWFKLTDLESETSREIMQFHYTTWPDFAIPSSPDAFLKFLQQVRDSGGLSPDVGPAVVHCSAGIGRSGTFCLVDCCLVLVDKYGECNVSQILCELRSYRMGLIQTSDQLDFSYQAIIEGIKKLNDPTFLDAEEPLLSNDTDIPIQDELPPPLPPRTCSLPPAPNTGGVLSLDMRAAKANGQQPDHGQVSCGDIIGDKPASKDALNNFINQHEIINAEAADSLRRPLPPLPSRLDSDSDEDEDGDYGIGNHNDDDDDDDEDDDDDDDDEDEADDDDDDVAGDIENILDTEFDNLNSSELEPMNGNLSSQSTTATEKKTAMESDDVNANSEKPPTPAEQQQHKVNGIDLASPETELKRRKRNEYQASLEQKVNDIKRKQRENEDSQQAAKKRRSLLTYIAAGVVVGVICAYAYTKLG